VDGGQEDIFTLVVAGRNASKVFEPAKHALDEVSFFISAFVEPVWMLSGGVWRDHRAYLALGEFLAQAIGIIGPVGQQAHRVANHSDQAACAAQIVSVSCGNQNSDRPANIIS
jgi:hypothetical protein